MQKAQLQLMQPYAH